MNNHKSFYTVPPKRCSKGDQRFKSRLWNDDKSSPTIFTHGDEVKTH